MNLMKLTAASLVTAVLLVGCGGGGKDAGTSPFGGSTPGGSTVVPASLTLALDKATVLDTDTVAVVATATAVDASGRTLTGIPISYTVSGGIYTQSTSTTDVSGNNVATISMGADKSNRTITVTASDGTHSATRVISVTGAKLTAVANPGVIAPGASGSIDFLVTDASSSPLASQPIRVVMPGYPTRDVTTDSSGRYSYQYTAPPSNTTLSATAQSAGVVLQQDILVQSSSASVTDAQPITSPSIAVNPSVIGVNTAGSTSKQVVVRALFKGAGNLPLQNVRVKFDLNGDTNNVGGTFSAPVVYSDANGYAVTSYIPGTISSPTNGVTIRACYSETGDPATTGSRSPVRAVTAPLTVTADAVSVTIGSDEQIGVDDANLQYYRRFIVQVVDASGLARSGVTITPQIDLPTYYKGRFTQATAGGAWTIASSGSPATLNIATCANEDANRNAVLDVTEDKNGDNILWPRAADAAVSYDSPTSTGKTDANGRLVLRVTYPKNVATWLDISLAVTASVSGSEGRAVWVEHLPFPADALAGPGAPAFAISPYGIAYDDVVIGGVTKTPCENPN